MCLIGLNGRAGAGKDTVGRFIKEWGELHERTVERRGFADLLKLSTARLFRPQIELEDALAWCNEVKEFGTLTVVVVNEAVSRSESILGRTLLQRYGTEAHRDVFGSDFWIDFALKDRRADITVLTDCRFPNEATAIHAHKGEVWEVVRPGHQIADSSHASEQALWPELIHEHLGNVASLDSLRARTFELLDDRF